MPSRRPRPLMSIALLALTASTLAACGSDEPSAATDAPDATDVPVTEVADTDVPVTEVASTDVPATDVPATDGAPSDESTPGSIVDSEFCRTAAEAEALGDEVDAAQAAGPAALEAAVTAAFDAAAATLVLAPPDIADVMARNVEFQERFVAILEQYDWDPAAAFSSAEGQAFARDGAAVEVELDQVRTYLEEQCGIIDDSDEP